MKTNPRCWNVREMNMFDDLLGIFIYAFSFTVILRFWKSPFIYLENSII